jgi:hypothetical protein
MSGNGCSYTLFRGTITAHHRNGECVVEIDGVSEYDEFDANGLAMIVAETIDKEGDVPTFN